MADAGPSRLPAITVLPTQHPSRRPFGADDNDAHSDWEEPWNVDNDDDLGIAGMLRDMEDLKVSTIQWRTGDGNGQSVAEDDPVQPDAIAVLNNAVERRLELVPAAPFVVIYPAYVQFVMTLRPLPNTADRAANALGRRLTSAISNIWSKSKSRLLTKTVRECIACTDPIIGKTIRVPCGHYYDAECIVSLFVAASKDESLFPPRCCKRFISFRSVREHFQDSVRDTFLEKSREFSTPRRVYCARPQCSRFLGPQPVAKRSRPKAYSCACGTVTCCQCKQAHQDTDGAEHVCAGIIDEATEVVLALGKERGWPRCPGCRTMIELNLGCYHMTCVCKVEFCYLCEARWKTCACPQWDERRLEAVAQERVQFQLEHFAAPRRPAPVLRRWRHHPAALEVPVIIAPPFDPEEQFRAIVEDLRVNHECQHTQWRYRDGGGRCSGCFDVLDRYVYHCMGCHTIACNRCRLNRF